MTAFGITIKSQKSQGESNYWCAWFCTANLYSSTSKLNIHFLSLYSQLLAFVQYKSKYKSNPSYVKHRLVLDTLGKVLERDSSSQMSPTQSTINLFCVKNKISVP